MDQEDDRTPYFRAVDAVSLGRSLAEARKEAGLMQQEPAKRLGVGRGTVVRLEQGEAVSMVVAMKAIRLVGREVALVPRFTRLEVKR